VRLQHLADVHTARHAQRVQDDVNRSPVFQEGHILDRDNLRDDALVAVPPRHLVALGQLALLRHADAHHLVNPCREVAVLFAGEDLHIHHFATLAVRLAQRRILDLARLLAENGPQQLLLRAEFLLALRRDLAHQDVVGANFRADADDAGLVQVFERLFADVRDVVGDLFRAELGVARLDLVLFDVNRGELVLAHQLLADQQGVLVVPALPGQERGQHIVTQRQFPKNC